MKYRAIVFHYLWMLFIGISIPSAMYAQAADSVAMQRFHVAESYLRSGQYERAIPILEDLYQRYPEVYAFFNRLKQAYTQTKQYDRALQLLEKRLSGTFPPTLAAEKGVLLYHKGEEFAAFQLWDEIIEQQADNIGAYRTVYYTLFRLRLFDKAIEVLERARAYFHDASLFRRDLAYLYGLAGYYEQSITEYLALLTEEPGQLAFVKNRINRLIEQSEALPVFIRLTERAIRRAPLNRSLRELAAYLYFSAGQYRQALATFRAIDRLEKEQGRSLFSFAQTATAAGAYEVAREAYEEIIRQYGTSSLAPPSLFYLGDLYEKQATHCTATDSCAVAFYRKAATTYQQFITQYPEHPLFPQVALRLARIQEQAFHRLTDARQRYQELIQRFPHTDVAIQAQFYAGQLAIQQGQLTEARLIFAQLENDLRIGELAEKARLEQARIDFYRGQFESALTRLRAMNRNTASDVANDAILLKVFIRENQGPDSLNTPLRLYAQAELSKRQHQPEHALLLIDSLLARFPQHPLNDDAYFLKAQLLTDRRHFEEAVTLLQELPLRYPRSPLSEQSLFLAAQILDQSIRNPAAALKAYETFLMRYPASLYAAKARKRIRELQQQS